MKKISFILFIAFLTFSELSFPQLKHFITVAKDGSGDFETVTDAIYSLPMFCYERVVIYIKNGVYNEKFRIDQDNITLRGESRDSTIIEYSQLRTDWITNKDSIGPAVINISGDDIIFDNLTIENTQPIVGPHAFAIYGTGTRTIIINCNVWSKGGDTVSLWDYKTGMYYHANCDFKGSVDFVCPRGWCFIRNSKFYEENRTASIWHAGGFEKDQKFVLKNCSFDGVKGFQLGRNHYDAQFYLLDCKFSKNMADKDIYRVKYKNNPERNRPDNWGRRNYYYNCLKVGGNYDWFKNNLSTAEGSPKPSEITPAWTFDDKWNPESTKGPVIKNYIIENDKVLLTFSESITVIGKPELRSGTGKVFYYNSGAGSDTIKLDFNNQISKVDLYGLKLINNGKILGTTATVKERPAAFSFQF